MTTAATGEPDLAHIAVAFADPRRVRVLIALADGRALPAGRLAEEAGVSASTVSNHLAILLAHGLVTASQQGRHRYYRLTGPDVEGVLEALARLAPRTPITSLRQHTRANALRTARTCYRHLAGQLGVRLFRDMIDAGWVAGGDGRYHPGDTDDRLSAPGKGTGYRLTADGADTFTKLGVPESKLTTATPLRYCVDWTEQAHHLSGPLGTAVTDRLFELEWITRGIVPRSVRVTPEGEQRIKELLAAQPEQRPALPGRPDETGDRVEERLQVRGELGSRRLRAARQLRSGRQQPEQRVHRTPQAERVRRQRRDDADRDGDRAERGGPGQPHAPDSAGGGEGQPHRHRAPERPAYDSDRRAAGNRGKHVPGVGRPASRPAQPVRCDDGEPRPLEPGDDPRPPQNQPAPMSSHNPP